MTRRIKIPNLDHLVELYQSGVPLQRIAKESGYTRTVLSKRLVEAGVKIRGYSDGQTARWRDAEDRTAAAQKWLGKAWQARRSSLDDMATRKARALERFQRQSCFGTKGKGIHEDEIAAFLRSNRFPILQQFPIGPYNVDMAVSGFPIAIEVSRSGATEFRPNSHLLQRLEYLLDRKWFILYIIATTNGRGNPRSIDLQTVGQDLVAWLELAGRDESLRGYYWVIWGHGHPPARSRYDFDELPRVPRPLRPHEAT